MISPWNYRQRLERDLERWSANGWVSAEGAAAIRADASGAGSGLTLAHSLAILAAVLMGFAVMSFVGANWQEMPRIARLGLLVGSLTLSYLGAGALLSRGHDGFGHALVLLGTALFGASIMLVAQMYHMDGNPPDAVLVWALGTLLAGVLLRSNAALAFAMVLMCTWGDMEMSERSEVYWPFLLGWAPVAAAYVWRKWHPGVHLAGLGLSSFVILIGYLLNDGHAHPIVIAAGLATALTAVAAENLWPRVAGILPAVLGYGVVTAFAGLYAMQFIETPTLSEFALLAALTLVLVLTTIWWGLARGQKSLLWLGYTGFSLEILGIYFKTLGTLMDTSLFFAVAALIVAALAVAALKLKATGTALAASRKEAR